MKYLILLWLAGSAVNGKGRNKLVCTTASDIRNCVIGNIRLMDKIRKDMKNFKTYIESRT